MSQMTKIQRDALAMAQRGDWRLADAMELLRRKETQFRVKGLVLSHGLLECGRMRALVYTNSVDCRMCDGDGEIECCECGHSRDCKECDGSGRVYGVHEAESELEITVDLNGNEVEMSHKAKVLDFSGAKELLATYNAGLLSKAPNSEQKELSPCA
jgi:hypothetical protein